MLSGVGTSPAIPSGTANRKEAMSMNLAKKLELIMAAAAFAEENEHGKALELLGDQADTEPGELHAAGSPQPFRQLLAE